MLTLSSALDRARRFYPGRKAIVDYEGSWTWRQHTDRVARAAGALAGLGVAAGDRFAILSRNTFRHCELLHAGYWMGAVPVPVNIRLAAPEIEHILTDSGSKVVAVEDFFLELLDSKELAHWKGTAFCVSAQDGAHGLPDYEALLNAADPAPLHEAAEEDDATILYTGGTTGRSKGVRLSHRNVVANGLQCGQSMGFGGGHTYLHVAPMFHSADLLGTGFTLMGGAHAYLPVFTPDNLLCAIQDLKATHTMLAPTMIIMTLQEADVSAYDLSSLEWFLYGSAPMAAEWIQRTIEAFKGVKVEQGYGLTETSPILTYLSMAEHEEALASGNLDRLKAAGRPIVGVDMRIVDDSDNEVPLGEAGEIVVRAPNVTSKGYLNLPEVNETTFRDGWFHTGDVGRFDDEGFMYLLDRKKDVIITGGENVYSSEVESVLYQHPDVSEAAVVGVPDEKYGEALFAAIVPAPGKTLTAEQMIEHCRGKIGGYKIPRQMAFLDAMPKSAMGKILKTELRRIYGGGAQKAKAS